MKKFINLFAVFAIVGMVFIGCQKNESLLEPKKSNQAEKIVDAQQSFPVDKGATIIKYDTKYVMDGYGDLKPCKTMKIRNLNWSIVQEWLFVDLNTSSPVDGTDLFQNVSYYPGDTYGATHGVYYPWSQIEDAADNNDWKSIVYKDNGYTSVSGEFFHLPKMDTYVGANNGDITKLAMMLGSTSLVRKKLALDYDGVDNSYPEFVNTHAYMWIEARGTYQQPNIAPGCGALAKWDGADNDHFWYSLPGITNLKANVRLVRNITAAQW